MQPQHTLWNVAFDCQVDGIASDVRMAGTSKESARGAHWRSVPALILVGLLSGCSLGMALSGSENPDLGAIKAGSSRGEIEMHLGSPKSSLALVDGRRTEIYEYEIGNEPSAGRAIGHGAMDVLTFGLWEVVGTPIEGVQGERFQATITYDRDDKVVDIKTKKAS
jgi:hypothetical protein